MNTESPGADHLRKVPAEHILASIETLQNRQKRSRSDSDEWIGCSESLQPLFAEMARRQREAS